MDRYWKGALPEPSVRTVRDMACVLADPNTAGTNLGPDTPLYYMYRDLAMTEEDRTYLKSQDVRYDITVIPPLDPNLLGGEYVKTKGHYNLDNPEGVCYPELSLASQEKPVISSKKLSNVVVVTASGKNKVLFI